MPLISAQEADRQLFNAYRTWVDASRGYDEGNSGYGCDSISRKTFNMLRGKWEGSFSGGAIYRNVAKSVSGGGYTGSNVRHFRAVWDGYKFIWHFKVTD